MIIDHKRVFSTLNKILPTYYNQLVEKNDLPCIIYWEVSNRDDRVSCETMGYSNIAFNVKVVGINLQNVATKAEEVDSAMRQLGYKRTASNDLVVDDMVQMVMTYEGLGFEHFK